MRRPGMHIPTVEQVSLPHMCSFLGVFKCDTFQKQLYLIILCVFFSFSLRVFSNDTSCDSEYLKSYQLYIGFF